MQVLWKISAERSEGRTTAEARQSRVQNYHKPPKTNRSALLHATTCRDGRKANVQVLQEISVERSEGRTTAEAWRSCVQNYSKAPETNRSTLLYAMPCRKGSKAIMQVLREISAERSEGRTTAAAWRSRVKKCHKATETDWSALLYATPCQEQRKASVQVLREMSA